MDLKLSEDVIKRQQSQMHLVFQRLTENLTFFAKQKQLQKDSCGSGEHQEQTLILSVRIGVCKPQAE